MPAAMLLRRMTALNKEFYHAAFGWLRMLNFPQNSSLGLFLHVWAKSMSGPSLFVPLPIFKSTDRTASFGSFISDLVKADMHKKQGGPLVLR